MNGVNDAAADSDDDDGEDDGEEKEEEDENGLALTPVSWQCAMMKAEYHWVVPCTLSVVHHCLCTCHRHLYTHHHHHHVVMITSTL